MANYHSRSGVGGAGPDAQRNKGGATKAPKAKAKAKAVSLEERVNSALDMAEAMSSSGYGYLAMPYIRAAGGLALKGRNQPYCPCIHPGRGGTG